MRSSHIQKAWLAFLIFASLVAGCTNRENTSKANQLNLYIWSAYVADSVLKEFKKKTGIEVRYDTYDSNEAMLEKLQSGAANYDIVAPSNETVSLMVEMNLLQKLDTNKLPNLKNISPRFRNPSYDPNNEHAIPFVWGTTGIGYNKSKVTDPVDTWAILWNPKYKGRILMLDDTWECFGAALKWKGHSLNSTNPAELEQAKNLLLTQKPLVKLYNSSNFDEALLSGDVWLAQGWNGQLAKAKDRNKNLGYSVPKEGSAFWIDSLAIPISANHKEEAHQFLNFCLEPSVAAEITNFTGYASANEKAKAYIRPEILNDTARYPEQATLERCEWFGLRGKANQVLDRYWTEIKSQ